MLVSVILSRILAFKLLFFDEAVFRPQIILIIADSVPIIRISTVSYEALLLHSKQ